jgi:hypothetical protein
MPGTALKQSVDITEQIFRLLRDAALGLLFFCLILFPSFLNSRLASAGFTKIEKGGITWEKQVQAANEQTKAAAATVSSASQALQDVNAQLTEVAAKSKDPQVKSLIAESLVRLNGTLGDVTKADSSLKETVLTQQNLLAQSGTGGASGTQVGWIFVGQVDENKQKWAPESPKNILPVPWPIQVGQTITVSGLSYLRGDSPTESHREASVVSVVKDRTRLEVQNIDYSHAISGGWFVWIKAAAPANSPNTNN